MSSTDGWCLGQDLNLETPKYDEMLLQSPARNITTMHNQTLFTIFQNCSCFSISVQFILKTVNAFMYVLMCSKCKVPVYTMKAYGEGREVLSPLILNLATNSK